MNDRKIYVGESFESKEGRAIMPIEGKMPPFSEEQLHVSRMEKEEFINLLTLERTKVIKKIQSYYKEDAHTQSFACSMVQRLYASVKKKVQEMKERKKNIK